MSANFNNFVIQIPFFVQQYDQLIFLRPSYETVISCDYFQISVTIYKFGVVMFCTDISNNLFAILTLYIPHVLCVSFIGWLKYVFVTFI